MNEIQIQPLNDFLQGFLRNNYFHINKIYEEDTQYIISCIAFKDDNIFFISLQDEGFVTFYNGEKTH